jgi:hypothetical protein
VQSRAADVVFENGHLDWPTYDRVMAEERRMAVLVQIERVYSSR